MNVSITCRRCTEMIIDFVCEEISDDDKSLFESHVKACPPCFAMVTTYRVTITMARKLPPRPLPETLLERLRKSASAGQ